MEQHYVDALRTDDHPIIKELYTGYRIDFLGFSMRYKLSEEDAIDIYQEAFITLRKHAISGKLYKVESSLKTYLFGIGKHLIYKKLKEYSLKTDYTPSLQKEEGFYEEVSVDPEEELTQEQLLLKRYFNQLGKSCQRMLTLSFYRGLTNEEISKLEGYESEAVVRSQKSRCLKTLKDLIKNSKENG